MKFRADTKDVMIFIIFVLFLLYIVAIAVLNISHLSEGVIWGLNPLPAFYQEYLKTTLIMYVIALVGTFAGVKSYFFEREKGFGFHSEKKSNGYSRWAKDVEMMKATKPVRLMDRDSEYAGVPLLYKKDIAYVDNSEAHTLVLGATGSGKTAGIVFPTVKFLSKKGESMIITDPKGEIYLNNGQMLRDRGYNIIILNFRDPQNGNCWNPYTLPYKYYKEDNLDKANELLNDLALNIMAEEQNSDPFWNNTAADYLTGLSLGMFDDASANEININTINFMMTVGDDRFGASTYLKEYFNAKDPNSPACINALGTVNAPNETKGGIIAVLRQKVKTLAVTKNLSEMLSRSDFDLDTIGERPTAVFMIIQDEKTTYHALATIFIKQCYEALISVAQKHGGKLPVRTNFIMDEFANMPKIKDMTTMITAARSRQIRFNMIIQNFAQLNQVYGKDNAETIKGNCTIIYLLTQELSALEEISKLCGDKIVKVGKDSREETRPLITISELQKMKEEEAIVIKSRQSPFRTRLRYAHKNNFGDSAFPKDTYPTREMQPVNLFDIREFVKGQKKNKLFDILEGGNQQANSPFGGMPMPNMQSAMASTGMAGLPNMNEDINVDELVKRIDAKIAELEEEERREKEAMIKGGVAPIEAEKSIVDYVPIEEKQPEPEIVVQEDKKKKELPEVEYKPVDTGKIITDDQFFDDFFTDND